MSLNVIVSGAGGKMGREVIRAVHGAEDMAVVGAVDPTWVGRDAGELAGIGSIGVEVAPSIDAALARAEAEALVDFTTPHAVYDNVMAALARGLGVVFGTTGLDDGALAAIDAKAREKGLGVVHAPNFAIGAVLMMRFAAEAARFFDDVEIIELHHDEKKDAPSGTAIKTAELVRRARGERRSVEAGTEVVRGARGGEVGGVKVHSVRLPGLVAHQEVLFGLPGQTLSIRHDSIDRISFMPGILLALRRVQSVRGLVYGLEHLLFEE